MGDFYVLPDRRTKFERASRPATFLGFIGVLAVLRKKGQNGQKWFCPFLGIDGQNSAPLRGRIMSVPQGVNMMAKGRLSATNPSQLS